MRGRGLKPNVVTYNSLINARVGNGDLKAAWRYFENMEQDDAKINAFTCSIFDAIRRTP